MKKLLILLINAFLLLSCGRKDDESAAPVDQLPPATQTGANTIGCLVNGNILVPFQSNPTGSPSKSCFYQFINGGYEFGMYLTNDKNGWRSVSIASNSLQFIEGNTYNIANEDVSSCLFANYKLNTSTYTVFETNSINKGELKITKLDTQHNILSGTFWFDAVNSAGEKVQIREGRFDFTYTP